MVKRMFPDAKGEMRWALDRTGARFGKLKVLRFDSFGKCEPIWWCRCDCGTEKAIPAQGLRTGRTRSCGCISVKAVFRGPGGGAAHTKFVQYKNKAKKMGLPFEFTEEEFIVITKMDCHYCRTPPYNSYKNNYSTAFVHNGIDRQDNKKGYTKDNSVPCCPICNRAKMDMSLEEFKEWLCKVRNYVQA